MAGELAKKVSATQPTSGQLVSIRFYEADKLPETYAQAAHDQGVRLDGGLVAVRTIMASPPRYFVEVVGSTPAQIKAYYARLAEEDGETLDDLAKKLTIG